MTGIDLFAPEVVRDPYPYLEEIRAEGPVVRNDATGAWMVTSFATASHVLRDWSRFSAEGGAQGAFFGPEAFIALDGDPHDRLRRVWARAFTRQGVEAYGPLVCEIVDDALDAMGPRLRAGETIEAVDELCRSLPTLVIAAMLGVPAEMRAQFHTWSDAMAAAAIVVADPAPRLRPRPSRRSTPWATT